MINCKNCKHYNKQFDKFLETLEDQIVVGKEEKETHHCVYFDKIYEGIPQEIWDNQEKCPYFEKK